MCSQLFFLGCHSVPGVGKFGSKFPVRIGVYHILFGCISPLQSGVLVLFRILLVARCVCVESCLGTDTLLCHGPQWNAVSSVPHKLLKRLRQPTAHHSYFSVTFLSKAPLSEVTCTENNNKRDTVTLRSASGAEPFKMKQYAFIGESMYISTPSDD